MSWGQSDKINYLYSIISLRFTRRSHTRLHMQKLDMLNALNLVVVVCVVFRSCVFRLVLVGRLDKLVFYIEQWKRIVQIIKTQYVSKTASALFLWPGKYLKMIILGFYSIFLISVVKFSNHCSLKSLQDRIQEDMMNIGRCNSTVHPKTTQFPHYLKNNVALLMSVNWSWSLTILNCHH